MSPPPIDFDFQFLIKVKKMQTLKERYWALIERYKEYTRRREFIKSHMGTKFFCNLCQWSGSDWYEKRMGRNIIGEVCPKCDSKPRQRLLKLVLEQTDFLNPALRLMHVSPHQAERGIVNWILSKKINYLSIDIQPGTAMKVMDLTALDLPDNTIDVIVCCHVLEHIENDLQAVREVYRVLRNNGVAFFQVPLYGALTEKVKTPTSEDHFHAWHPGLDYPERYELTGFKVSSFSRNDIDDTLADKLALSANDTVHICTKNA